MFHRIMRPAAILGAAALLAACEQQSQPQPAEAQTVTAAMTARTASPFVPVSYMKLKIKGADATSALDNESKVAALVGDLEDGTGIPERTLGQRIKDLLDNPSSKMAGLGGISARDALETAEVTLVPQGQTGQGNYGGPLRTFDVTGQIQDVVDLGGGTTEAGFYYNAGSPMHIWVEMITTTSRQLPNGNIKSKSRAEMFRVQIPYASVTVEDKDLDDLKDVFPDFGDVAFKVGADMAAPFLYKLWAVGTDIQVTDYWVDKNVQPGSEPNYPPGQRYNWQDQPNQIPDDVKNIFTTSANACIDMMFQKDPRVDVTNGGALDNGRLPADAAPPYYCLGRCSNPPILNTR